MTWLPHYYKITLKGRETGSSHRIMYCDVALEMPVPSQGHYGFHSFPLLTDFVCLYGYEFGLSLCKIVRSSVILLLPLFST